MGQGQFNGVRVFTATVFTEREKLGDRVTDWIRAHPTFEIDDVRVTQSSDNKYHMIAISVFYKDPTTTNRKGPTK